MFALRDMIKPHDRLVPVKLRELLRVHTWPINLVVYEGSSERPRGLGYLVSRPASRLDAFQRLSVPHIATQLCHWRDNWIARGASKQVTLVRWSAPASSIRFAHGR